MRIVLALDCCQPLEVGAPALAGFFSPGSGKL
jgi:hypothetical protein